MKKPAKKMDTEALIKKYGNLPVKKEAVVMVRKMISPPDPPAKPRKKK